MTDGAVGARIARGVADIGYPTTCLLLLAGGAWFRFSVPLWPLIEPDPWNYLWPALSAIERGVFTHAGARAFPYPLFLWTLLEGFGDFQAITAAQYLLGLATVLLGLAGWHAACRLIDPSGAWWIGHRVGGLVVLFALGFWLPERRLAETHDAFATRLFLPLPVDQHPFPAVMSATLGRDLAGYSAAFDRFVEALARSDEPKRRKLQNLTRLFYRPLERGANLIYAPIAGLALVAAVALSGRWGWRAAPVLTLAAMQLGIQRAIAMSHSHAVIRYRAAQYPLTILLLAVAALTLLAVAAALRRCDDKPRSSP